MQVTIDSSEPLERVLRVVGALYNVQLSVGEGLTEISAGEAVNGHETAAGPSRRRTRKASKAAAGRRGRPRTKVAVVDAAAVRRWAREHGYTVSERGPLPRSVTAEFTKAGSGH